MMLGTNTSFQVVEKTKIACVPMAGLRRGRMIWLKILNSPAPSILADSTISFEKVDFRYKRMNRMVTGEAMAGKISIESLLIMWNFQTS